MVIIWECNQLARQLEAAIWEITAVARSPTSLRAALRHTVGPPANIKRDVVPGQRGNLLGARSTREWLWSRPARCRAATKSSEATTKAPLSGRQVSALADRSQCSIALRSERLKSASL